MFILLLSKSLFTSRAFYNCKGMPTRNENLYSLSISFCGTKMIEILSFDPGFRYNLCPNNASTLFLEIKKLRNITVIFYATYIHIGFDLITRRRDRNEKIFELMILYAFVLVCFVVNLITSVLYVTCRI